MLQNNSFYFADAMHYWSEGDPNGKQECRGIKMSDSTHKKTFEKVELFNSSMQETQLFYCVDFTKLT